MTYKIQTNLKVILNKIQKIAENTILTTVNKIQAKVTIYIKMIFLMIINTIPIMKIVENMKDLSQTQRKL